MDDVYYRFFVYIYCKEDKTEAIFDWLKDHERDLDRADIYFENADADGYYWDGLEEEGIWLSMEALSGPYSTAPEAEDVNESLNRILSGTGIKVDDAQKQFLLESIDKIVWDLNSESLGDL